jgi:C1A family cysteine protease
MLSSSSFGNSTAGYADVSGWFSYSSGAFVSPSNPTLLTSLNQAVLIVGSDPSGNIVVKNSWGRSWGESGYITLSTENNPNPSGVLSMPFTTTIL